MTRGGKGLAQRSAVNVDAPIAIAIGTFIMKKNTNEAKSNVVNFYPPLAANGNLLSYFPKIPRSKATLSPLRQLGNYTEVPWRSPLQGIFVL